MSRRVRPRYPLSLRLRTAVSRRHRLVAAALCALAVTVLVLRFAPPEARTTSVVTATDTVAAGQPVREEQLTVTEFPADLVPHGALTETSAVVGRAATVSIGPGTPLTGSSVLGPGLLNGQPEGTTAASVRVSDPAALQNVQPGDRVDVVHHRDAGGNGSEPKTLAEAVTVLWVAGASQESSSILPADGSADSEGLVVLAADRGTASALASLDGTGTVSLVLVAP